ncbi:DUF4272 domain-containing protein [Neorhodopirellula lusitana]|uniref:DUF4272 domain-containing protein n=1 Tax=Neorhodopirellula lusitana TaxID=445327 RepID=UPI00384F4CA5
MAILVNAYCTHRSPAMMEFPHSNLQMRDRSDPELPKHLQDFIGFLMQGGEREMTQSLYAVYRHLQRVQNQASFEVEGENIEAISTWAIQSNAILFLPDGSVRDPRGKVLVDPDTGEAEDRATVPYLDGAVQRKSRTMDQLAQRSIHVAENLPPAVGEGEVELRSAEDVAWRSIGLLIAAVRAESVASEEPIAVDELRARAPLAFKAFTPAESEFVQDTNPDNQTVVNFAWRYESLFVLQWALGLHEALPFPDKICDVPGVARCMLPKNHGEILRQAKLRSTAEILDALDFNYRLLWSVRDAGLSKTEPPAGIDPGVVSERQHALNWLVRFEDSDWDHVDTPS